VTHGVTDVVAGNGTAECRVVTKPTGLSLYTARCNRTGYLIPNSSVSSAASVQIFPGVGHLPSTCSTDKQCWVYARCVAVVAVEQGRGGGGLLDHVSCSANQQHHLCKVTRL